MHTLQQLLFAQNFPFTKSAKKIVLEEDPSLEDLPESVIERAELMAKYAFAGKKYLFELHSSDLLLQELLAFPVAKIIVSFVNDTTLFRKFSAMVANSAYAFLTNEKEKGKAAISLASDFGLKFDFPESKSFFISMPLQQFLSVPFNDDSLKLVNQFVSDGIVFLDLNGFCRFLREKSYAVVLASLPVKVKGLPKRLESISKSLKTEAKAREQKLFATAFKGNIAPEAFPPCIASMYSQLASGQKLPHMANFTLATFLNSIKMPKSAILALFKKSPNFKEGIASYQLDRIAAQDYAPPSCDKIKSYGFCTDKNCKAKHPITYYRWKLRTSKKPVSKSADDSKAKEKKEVSK